MVLTFWVIAACGTNPEVMPGDHPGPMVDAGPEDAAPDNMPDAGDAGDAGVDAPPGDPNPFPPDPMGGEFAWMVSVRGVDAPGPMAADSDGNIAVAARQIDAVSFGQVQLPRPASSTNLLMLKLTSDGKAVWGRSFEGPEGLMRVYATGVAMTTDGDIVVGGVFQGGSLRFGDHVIANVGGQDGFVAVLDGLTGEPRWAASLGGSGDDTVVGVATGRDAGGATAIYVYGQLVQDVTIGDRVLAAGAYLLRYDSSGGVHWAHSILNVYPGVTRSIAMDAQRGPVITGAFSGDVTVDGSALPGLTGGSGDAMVAGFDPEGQARFARAIDSEDSELLYRSIALAPSGDVHVFSNATFRTTVVDGHTIWAPGIPEQVLRLRLTPDGRYGSSSLIAGSAFLQMEDVATDASGAAYMSARCSGVLLVQPEISCDPGDVSGIFSYGPDDQYRWATYIRFGFVSSLVAVPDNRLIVAGEASSPGGDVDFGGLRVPTQQLFIAALAGGPPRLPSPLPAAPAITSMGVDGQPDLEIRQGGSAMLVIDGAGLDHVTAARLGDIDIHVPPSAGTSSTLHLAVTIPHGHALGTLPLVLGNAAGSAQTVDVVTVTPIVVASNGSSTGRGTFASPMRLCRTDWLEIANFGDVVQLRDGVHSACGNFVLAGGVIARGDSTSTTIVQGGLSASGGHLGPAVIENLSFETDQATVSVSGNVVVTDVDIRGSSRPGIRVGSGHATLNRIRYLNGSSGVISVDGGSVDANQIEMNGQASGIVVTGGSLNLSNSQITSSAPAVYLGSEENRGPVITATISDSTLRSQTTGIRAAGAAVTLRGSTIEADPAADSIDGIFLVSGTLEVTDSVFRNWGNHAILTSPILDSASVTLDHATIASCRFGIQYDAGFIDGQFRMHHTHITAADDGVLLGGNYSVAELGTPASPGDNQIEVTSSGFGLAAGRPGVDVTAHGTALNGVIYTGDVQGPAEVPGAYSIGASTTIHF